VPHGPYHGVRRQRRCPSAVPTLHGPRVSRRLPPPAHLCPPRPQLRLARIPHLIDRFNLAESFCTGCAEACHSDCEVAYLGLGCASCDCVVLRRVQVHAGGGERRRRQGDGMRRTVAVQRGGERWRATSSMVETVRRRLRGSACRPYMAETVLGILDIYLCVALQRSAAAPHRSIMCRHHGRGRRLGTSNPSIPCSTSSRSEQVSVVPSLVPYAAGARTAKVRVGFLVKKRLQRLLRA